MFPFKSPFIRFPLLHSGEVVIINFHCGPVFSPGWTLKYVTRRSVCVRLFSALIDHWIIGVKITTSQ